MGGGEATATRLDKVVRSLPLDQTVTDSWVLDPHGAQELQQGPGLVLGLGTALALEQKQELRENPGVDGLRPRLRRGAAHGEQRPHGVLAALVVVGDEEDHLHQRAHRAAVPEQGLGAALQTHEKLQRRQRLCGVPSPGMGQIRDEPVDDAASDGAILIGL